jgi:D-alanyl-D-alanine carboxypeptidase
MSWAHRYGIPVTVTSGYRSWAEQTKLRGQYERCLAAGEEIEPGNPNPACRWPANEPGDSAHNYGLAWDSWVPKPYVWYWAYLRRAAGFHVPEHDVIHAEVPNWRQFATTIRRG